MTEEIAKLTSDPKGYFPVWFTAHRDQLERLIAFRLDRRIQARVDPADILQEVYLESFRRLEKFLAEPSVSIYVWVRQIAVQTLIDTQRRHFGQQRNPGREAARIRPNHDATSLSIAQALCDHQSTPSRNAVKAEAVEQLQQGLAELDEIDREVLAMRHFEQLGNNQVAEALGLTPSAASNRYVRAMKRLTEIMQKFDANG